MKQLLILLLTCLTCFSQSVELRSVTILGGVEIGTVAAAEAPAGPFYPPAFLAGVTNGSSPEGATTTTLTIGTISGENKLLIVGVVSYDDGGVTLNAVSNTTDGTLLTLAIGTNHYSANGTNTIWYQIAPSDGTSTITAFFSGGCDQIAIAAFVLTNAAQTDPIRSVSHDFLASNRTAVSNVLASATNDICIDSLASYVTTTPYPLDPATQIITAEGLDPSLDDVRMTRKLGAASVTMCWTNTVSARHDLVSISVKGP